MREEAASGVDCCDYVVGELTSACLDSAVGFVDLAGAVIIGVTSPADLAGGVTVRVTALGVAGAASHACPWPMLEWRPWPMLGWCPWPLLGWRPWPTLLKVLPSV